MPSPSSQEITRLLDAVGRGESDAAQKLWSIVYEELRRMAHRQMAAERPGRTMQPTALVNEAYLKLFGSRRGVFANRRHFFAAAGRAMRCIRTDDARRRQRLKRGGSPGDAANAMSGGDGGGALSAQRAPVEQLAVWDQDPAEIIAVDEALRRLEQEDPRKARVVELRYFSGLSIQEVAEAMDVSRRTVDSDWRFARAWLHEALSDV